MKYAFAAWALVALGSTAVQAADARLLASNCFQCHGTDGTDGSIESLAGESQRELYGELKEMQRKSPRSNIMYPHALGYTDTELQAIAAYFAKIKNSERGK